MWIVKFFLWVFWSDEFLIEFNNAFVDGSYIDDSRTEILDSKCTSGDEISVYGPSTDEL